MKRRELLKVAAAGTLSGWMDPHARCAGAESARATAKAGREEIAWTRNVPLRYEADVAVIGGGIAGVAAACAAAKSGRTAILVERFAVTGGNLTAGEGEVFDEMVAALEQFGAVEPYQPYTQAEHRVFDHHILAIVLQEVLWRRVKLLLHTRFVDARVTGGGRITECIVCGKSGPEALRAKQFIDTTGDADVARAAGFAVLKGRPEDGLQLPMSMMAFVRHVEKAGPQLPPGLVFAGPIQGRSPHGQRLAERPGCQRIEDQGPDVRLDRHGVVDGRGDPRATPDV
jgi:ribulose 1,5-bisphosphate synthetase/thiazole synthase